MNYEGEKTRKANISTGFEKIRLMLGLVMLFTGLYFGYFSVGISESLGLMSFMASPFVMIADK
jgi:hypothetical protein